LVYATETEEGENFKKKLKEALETQIDFVNKIEAANQENENKVVAESIENNNGEGLEKLSAIELESIRKELTRQRDTMSKKLIRQTEINVRLEKERENVYKAIQEEGKTLIKKCNVLRRAGLILKFRIGLCEKEAKELNDEIGSQAIQQEETQQKTISLPRIQQRKPELPFVEYKNQSELARRQPLQNLTQDLYEDQNFIDINITQLIRKLELKKKRMKEIDKLYEEARSHNLTVDNYQVIRY
jgi:hypothetical protein